ncbi:hypothetical protein M569_03062 [Genlisea aurea]|uniref:Uncharacterized protein n=1 Tax=Genlisea aurea TaxID=192259 RepID=S8EGA1_9LAMI|nr:hypothetical protein M569_03062 [Genlisea aurea]
MTTTESFNLTILDKKLIKIQQQDDGDPHVISPSNLDLLSGRFPVTYLFIYAHSSPSSSNFLASLSESLRIFYPFAARIAHNPNSGDLEIVCGDTSTGGVLFVHAAANVSLDDFDLYDLDRILEGKLVPVGDTDLGFKIQITTFACGSTAVTFTFDHLLGDASAFAKFLSTFSEIALRKPVSCSPDHTRNLKPRNPPVYDPAMDDSFVACTMEQIRNMPTIALPLIKRLYRVEKASIERLQGLAGENGTKRTKIEAFSSYIWKIMAASIKNKGKRCRMGWLVDGRRRMSSKSMENYIGNVVSIASGEMEVRAIRESSIADMAETVHRSISEVTVESHFRNLIDWIECKKRAGGLVSSKLVLGDGGDCPCIVVSSGRRFPVREVDLGFGNPVLGTVCSSVERLGVGYINQREGGSGDGSWTVSVILWREMVDAMESHPDSIFRPLHHHNSY